MPKNIRKKSGHDLHRRDFLGRTALGLAGVGGLWYLRCSGVETEPGSKHPNILLIVADDAGWRDVGYHGSEIKTRNLDRLRETGAELDQFYVCPTCSPTRASLLTGRPAGRFGILGPIAGKSKQVLPFDTLTLPQLLKLNGYATAITGKWHLGLRLENGPRKYGFEYTYGYLHGQIDPYTHLYKFGDRTWHRNDQLIEEEGHATDLITDEAIRFIADHRDKSRPFFLYVPYSVPHYPLNEDEKWIAPYRESIPDQSRRLFAASMSHLDDAVGRLLKTLQAENLQNNTMVIFMSDNGGQQNWLGTAEQYEGRYAPQRRLGDNRPLRDWKGTLYEGGIRVPALWNWPGRLSAKRVRSVISVTDILPTIAAIAGISLPPDHEIEGKNVWESIAQGAIGPDRTLYWRTDKQLAVRYGDWKLVHTGANPNVGVDELFDLAKDPLEQTDIAPQHPEKLSALRKVLLAQYALDQ
ncbi:sulfatase-like hydrolase/transferase [candidate division KSB1 bacterium]|nr:sulfatase-like hydrolase/transferase [candidate division KSB1 bacterium]